jgi:hypothetical protein
MAQFQPASAGPFAQRGSLHILTASALAAMALLWASVYASWVHAQHRQTLLAAQRLSLQSNHTQALGHILSLWDDPMNDAWALASSANCTAHPMRAQMDIGWECKRLAVTVPDPAITLEILAARDLIKAPQVAHISLSSQHDSGHTRLQERASLWTPDWGRAPTLSPASPDPALQAQLVLQGCQDSGGAAPGFSVFSLAVPDLDGNGTLSLSERIRCLAADLLVAPSSAADQLGGEIGPSPKPSDCAPRVWQRLFGSITPLQVQRLSQAQARAGLGQNTVPKRSMYWLDEASELREDLGDASNPVVLVFSEQACRTRCPSMPSSQRIFGTVYYASQCQAARMQGVQLGHVQGLVGVESGLPSWPSASSMGSLLQRESAFGFASLPSQTIGVAQLVPGSRHWP